MSYVNKLKITIALLLSSLLLGGVNPALATELTKPTVASISKSAIQNQFLQQGYLEVPLRVASNQNALLIDVSFGSGKTVPFLLDTGSTLTTIDKKLATDLNFPVVKGISKLIAGGDNRRNRVPQVTASIFQMSNFTSNNEPFYVMDYSFAEVDKQPIAGFIGLDFLKKHQAVLDIANKRLYLKPNPSNLASAKNMLDQSLLLKAGYQATRLLRSPSGHFILLAQVNDRDPVRFLFDSGVPQTMLSLNYARTLGLEQIGRTIVGYGSGGGEMKVYRARISNFAAGSINWIPENVLVTDFSYVQLGTPIFGIIGLDWMQASQAIIDVADDLLLVKLKVS